MNSDELLKIARNLENSSKEILIQFASLKIENANSSIKKENEIFSCYDLSFAIGVTGIFNGSVVMNLNKQMAFFLAGSMTCRERITELDELTKSALGEFSNMVVGQTLSGFVEKGDLNITPPEFILYNHKIKLLNARDNICVTQLDTKKGVIEFMFSLIKR